MSDSDRAINAKHCINVIGYSAGIYTSIGRSGDIRGVETLFMLHLQRHAALAIAVTAQVWFVRIVVTNETTSPLQVWLSNPKHCRLLNRIATQQGN